MSESVTNPVPKRVGDSYVITFASENFQDGMWLLITGPYGWPTFFFSKDRKRIEEKRFGVSVYHLRMLDEAEVPYIVVEYRSRGW